MAASLNLMFRDKGSKGLSDQNGLFQSHPETPASLTSAVRTAVCTVGEVTAGHTDSPPLHGLWLCSVSEALIKEGPQQVFENLFLPTVL